MKKSIIATFAACMLIIVQPYAQTATYSNDFFSFDYDTDVEITFNVSVLGSINLYYSFQLPKKDSSYFRGVSIRISETENATELLQPLLEEEDGDNYARKILSKNEVYWISKDESEAIDEYRKFFIANNNNQYVIVSYLINQDERINDFFKTVYDSFTISDSFIENGYSIPDDYYGETLFGTPVYSEQAHLYAIGALDIFNQYFSMKIDGTEASRQIKSLYNRIESYLEVSEYYADSDLKQTLYLTDLSFSMGSDGRLYEKKKELENIVNAKYE